VHIRIDHLLRGAVGASPGGGRGTIYYVSPQGNDGNNGKSSSSPWKTLDKVDKTPSSQAIPFSSNAAVCGAGSCGKLQRHA